MSLTVKQLEARKKYLGASDSPAILGLSPFATPGDVYWSKVADVPQKEAEHLDTGNWLEGPLVEWAAEKLGVKVDYRNRTRVKDFMACNVDMKVPGQAQSIEAKVVGPDHADKWGEEGTDQVPDYVQVQAQHQCHVADLELVWVPALICRFRPVRVLYRVERHEGLIQTIVEKEREFWEQHVVPRVPPPDMLSPPIEVLRHLRREPGKVVEIADTTAIYYLSAMEKAKEVTKDADETKRWLLEKLGDAEGAECSLGTFTYLSQKSTPKVDHDRMKADGVWDKYIEQGTHRVLRFKKAKGE